MSRVYVEQYETFWSFSFSDWLQFLLEIKGDGYELPENKLLKTVPRCMVRYDDTYESFGEEFTERSEYFLMEPGHRHVKPLDWDDDQFHDEILEMKELIYEQTQIP